MTPPNNTPTSMTKEDVAVLWQSSRLKITDSFGTPPEILNVGDSVIGTLGNFSASTGKAKSKKTFNITAIVEQVIYGTESLGLVIIDGIRDLAYDINSPSKATTLISKLMQWTDERQHPRKDLITRN